MCARSHARPVDPANTQIGVAKRVAGDIGYCLGLGPKSAAREEAGSAFCPLTRVTPPAIVCRIDRSGVRVARRAFAQPAVGHVDGTRAAARAKGYRVEDAFSRPSLAR